MPTPMVSVVIPAYNHERFIGPAIESVLGQTLGDLELIVINDGSRDRTGEVARSFKDPRLTCIDQPNQDAYNALNRGMGLARGRYIAILNSDDLYLPGRLQRLAAECDAGRCDCVFTDVEPIDPEGRPVTDPDYPWNVWHRRNRQFYFDCGDLYTAFLHGNFMVSTSNLFLRADLARKVGGFSPLRYLHDYDYIFRVMLAAPGRVRYLDRERLVRYRLHGGNTLGQGAVLAREQDREVIRKYMLEGLPEQWRGRAAAGADRLVELERELLRERARLQAPRPPGVAASARALAAAARRAVGGLLRK